MRRLVFLAAVAVGCGVPEKVRIIDSVEDDGSYGTRDVELATLEDLDAVAGEIGQMFGGSEVRIAAMVPPKDRGADRDEFLDAKSEVVAQWMDVGGVAVATDFDTLSMFTAYAHLEGAALMFERLGVQLSGVAAGLDADERVPLLYRPDIKGSFLFGIPETDNAAFVAGLDLFLILPMDRLQDIPFGMNAGVLAHEYSHRVWYYELWGGEMVAILKEHGASPDWTSAFNLLRAADEGVADFFGFVASGDPDFIGPSAGGLLHDTRALDVVRVVEPGWSGGVEPAVDGVYNPYALGAVLASTLWRLQEVTGPEALAHIVLDAERGVGDRFRRELTYALGDFESAIIAGMPAAHRCAACAQMHRSYDVVWDRLADSCGACP